MPGMLASHTIVPVLGVPIQSRTFSGMDSLLSIVQMPAGIPVATFAIGVAGAKNAALFAAALLAGTHPAIGEALARLSSPADSGRARQRIGSLKTRVLAAPEGLEPAAKLLAAGELVALPTETVYGLGAAALNPLGLCQRFSKRRNGHLVIH